MKTDFDRWLLRYFFARGHRTALLQARPAGALLRSTVAEAFDAAPSLIGVLDLWRTLLTRYDQVVILGDPILLKAVVEEGAGRHGWGRLGDLHLIPTGRSHTEGWRDYLQSYLHPQSRILGFVEVPELGGPVFFETPESVQIRKSAQKDRRLQSLLFGKETRLAPAIFEYNPDKISIELLASSPETTQKELILTQRPANGLMPLIVRNGRYSGRIIGKEELLKKLKDSGYTDALPSFQSPLVTLQQPSGTQNAWHADITREALEEGLYRSPTAASEVTGRYVMRPGIHGVEIHLQLKPKDEFQPFMPELVQNLCNYISARFRVCLHLFEDFPLYTHPQNKTPQT